MIGIVLTIANGNLLANTKQELQQQIDRMKELLQEARAEWGKAINSPICAFVPHVEILEDLDTREYCDTLELAGRKVELLKE